MVLLAAAHGVVVDHLALGGGPAGPGARVPALLVDAGQVTGALAWIICIISTDGKLARVGSKIPDTTIHVTCADNLNQAAEQK